MESKTQHQPTSVEGVSVSQAFDPRVKLSPELVVLATIANTYYDRVTKDAVASDEKQNGFTEAGVGYVRASSLTAVMAVRAAQMASQRSA
jgi:hypothetical protein